MVKKKTYKVYSVVYHANRKPDLKTHTIHNSEPVKEHYKKVLDIGTFPEDTNNLKIDMGDDPSILAYATGLGFFTWGTCRPDKRNSIDVGDYVVFFAHEINNNSHKYYLSGYAKVTERISQANFLSEKDNGSKKYPNAEKYANLLIKESNGKYIWNEWPGKPDNGNNIFNCIKRQLTKSGLNPETASDFQKTYKEYCWHTDWYKRILNGYSTESIGKDGFTRNFAENYIIFGEEKILKNPICVATATINKNGQLDIKWENDNIKLLTYPCVYKIKPEQNKNNNVDKQLKQAHCKQKTIRRKSTKYILKKQGLIANKNGNAIKHSDAVQIFSKEELSDHLSNLNEAIRTISNEQNSMEYASIHDLVINPSKQSI